MIRVSAKAVSCGLLAAFLLSGCAAKLTFIDRQDGQMYRGSTGTTAGSSGEATVVIESETYTGEWIYTSGGSYAIGTMLASSGRATATGTLTGLTMDARGNGMMHLRNPAGKFIRCVFDYSSMSETGTGSCQRNDGRVYDLTIQ